MFPEDEPGSILIRLANIADLFDSSPSATPYFDLEGYALALYKQANDIEPTGNGDTRVELTERTLSNSMDYDEMKKTQWKTVTGDSDQARPLDLIDEGKVALEPQRIRLFRAEYHQTMMTGKRMHYPVSRNPQGDFGGFLA